MGARGPAREPTALKLVKGTATEDNLHDEPSPAKRLAEPPAWLKSLGGDELGNWNSLAPDLISQGVLTFWDTAAFSRWCALEVFNRRLLVELIGEGAITVNRGRPAKNQKAQIYRDTQVLLNQLSARFGLTPSDRAQLPLTTEPKAGYLDQFFD